MKGVVNSFNSNLVNNSFANLDSVKQDKNLQPPALWKKIAAVAAIIFAAVALIVACIVPILPIAFIILAVACPIVIGASLFYLRATAIKEKKRQEAIEKAHQEAVEKTRREAAEKARREALEKARLEAEAAARAKREVEERARLEAIEKAKQIAIEKARQEAMEKARQEAIEKARQEAAEKTRQEAIEKARQEAAEKTRLEVEEKTRLETIEKARQEQALTIKPEPTEVVVTSETEEPQPLVTVDETTPGQYLWSWTKKAGAAVVTTLSNTSLVKKVDQTCRSVGGGLGLVAQGDFKLGAVSLLQAALHHSDAFLKMTMTPEQWDLLQTTRRIEKAAP